MRKVFLDDLPHKYGIGINKNKLVIDWKVSMNCIVPFIYDNIQGDVKIINYYKENKGIYVRIQYNNKIYFMATSQFINCQFGDVLGVNTNRYRYQIGDVITDIHSGKLQILEQIRMNKNNVKGYKYKCLICGNEDSITEGNLTSNHRGCNVCGKPCRKVLVEYNDMWTTNPELAKLLLNKNDGYKYTENSHKKVNWKCPNCGNIIKNKQIKMVNMNNLSCPKCGDGISYPNKFVFNIIQQLLNDDFENEKVFDWSENKRYDFYFKINNEKYVLEVNGLQHYEEWSQGRTLKDEQENDRLKKELALQNRIKEENYIVIDCRESTLEWIKEHILSSKLNDIFDLSKVDWLVSLEYACSSLVKKACDLWNSGIYSTVKIGKIMKIGKGSIQKYLKRGAKLGWCNYNPKDVKRNTILINGKKIHTYNYKKVICLNSNKIFNSVYEAANYYYIKSTRHIYDCCKNNRKSAGINPVTGKKLYWQYYDEYIITPKKK